MLIRYNGRDTFALPGDYESPIEQLLEFAKHASRMRRVPAELKDAEAAWACGDVPQDRQASRPLRAA
jgi:hypothetical protein